MNLSTDIKPKPPAGEATAPRKFMFDKSFDQMGQARPQERPSVTLRPEQLDQIKKECFDSGFAAGQKANGEEQALRQASTLTRVEEQLTRVVQNMQLLHTQHDKQLRSIILAVIRKVLPSFMAKQGLDEIQTMIADIMGEMGHEPRLVVRVNEAQFDAISTKVNDIATQKAYPGKVVVLADAEIASGDCRIEWADGGIERKASETVKTVETIVAPEGVPPESEAAAAPAPTAEAKVEAEAKPVEQTPPAQEIQKE
jgi:flagellar assembly protein FliH